MALTLTVLSGGPGMASLATAQSLEDSVPEIAILQELLARRGFDPGEFDGVKGPATTDAIIAAQTAYGLEPDGIVGAVTLAALQGEEAGVVGGGNSSDDVADLQQLLADRGFYAGEIDGIEGPATQAAIIAAQRAYNLTPDGIAGSATLAALQAGETDTSAAPSAETINLQRLLAQRNFYSGSIDGIEGPATQAAIIAAQRAYNLTPDGIAGSATLAALQADGNSPQPDNSSSSNGEIAEVITLQRLLTDRSFYTGAIDGIKGPATRDAIVLAQKFYGLTPDGIAGAATLAALQSNSNDTVVAPSAVTTNLQRLLAQRNFYSGPIDGIEGPATQAAIIAAQRAYNLTPDGIAGSATLAALQSDFVPAPSTPENSSISNLQNLLIDRGFYSGPRDGILGTMTRDAIVAAQKAYGLPANGVPDAAIVSALERSAPSSVQAIAPVVTPFSSSVQQVAELQRLLALRSFYTGPVNGQLGNETLNAVTKAQKFYGIEPADGRVTQFLTESLRRDPFVASL